MAKKRGKKDPQLDLFADNNSPPQPAPQSAPKHTAPYQPHSLTSKEAALSVEPIIGAQLQRVLNYVRQKGDEGATDEEIALGLPMPQNSERPRRIQLVKAGLLKDSGRTRPFISERHGVVWVAVQIPSSQDTTSPPGEQPASDTSLKSDATGTGT